MKPKELIKKYKLEKGWKSNYQNDFLQDITSELLAFLEYNKADNNIKGFDNAVKVIRMKWNAVSNKIPFGLPDKLWSFFWATTVVKLREEFCPKDVERMRKKAEEKKAQWDRQQTWKKEQDEFFNDMYRKAKMTLLYIILNSVPSESFQYLDLSENATEEEIKQRFRELSLKVHPDRGGTEEEFIKLIEHKNKCLKWASKI